jgi:hypothetical protein
VISVAATFGGQRGAYTALELRHENAEGPVLIAVKARKEPEHLNSYKIVLSRGECGLPSIFPAADALYPPGERSNGIHPERNL